MLNCYKLEAYALFCFFIFVVYHRKTIKSRASAINYYSNLPTVKIFVNTHIFQLFGIILRTESDKPHGECQTSKTRKKHTHELF